VSSQPKIKNQEIEILIVFLWGLATACRSTAEFKHDKETGCERESSEKNFKPESFNEI